jgi:hypothetical protein
LTEEFLTLALIKTERDKQMETEAGNYYWQKNLNYLTDQKIKDAFRVQLI